MKTTFLCQYNMCSCFTKDHRTDSSIEEISPYMVFNLFTRMPYIFLCRIFSFGVNNKVISPLLLLTIILPRMYVWRVRAYDVCIFNVGHKYWFPWRFEVIHKYLFILSGLFEVAHMYLFSVFQGVQKCQLVFEVTYVFQSWPVLEVVHKYLFISVSGYTPVLACIWGCTYVFVYISVSGYTPALACAPNSEVADCLAMILAIMFPMQSPNCTMNRSSRLHSNTVTLSKMICILYGFPCEMEFSHHKSPNPTLVGIRRRVVRNPSRMEAMQKWIFSHTLHFKAR